MFYVLSCFLIIGFIDLWPLIKERERRELVVTGIISLIGLTIALLYVSGVDLPSPIVAADRFITQVLHLGY